MQATGFLNYRLKYCWPKVIYCVCQPNKLEREIKKSWRGQAGGQDKPGVAIWPTQTPLRIATGFWPPLLLNPGDGPGLK